MQRARGAQQACAPIKDTHHTWHARAPSRAHSLSTASLWPRSPCSPEPVPSEHELGELGAGQARHDLLQDVTRLLTARPVCRREALKAVPLQDAVCGPRLRDEPPAPQHAMRAARVSISTLPRSVSSFPQSAVPAWDDLPHLKRTTSSTSAAWQMVSTFPSSRFLCAWWTSEAERTREGGRRSDGPDGSGAAFSSNCDSSSSVIHPTCLRGSNSG